MFIVRKPTSDQKPELISLEQKGETPGGGDGRKPRQSRENFKCYAKCLHDSIYLKCQTRQIYRDGKQISDCLGLGVKTETHCKGAGRVFLGEMESIYSWIEVMVAVL